MKPIWFKNHTAYTMAKYGMSMCVLGMSAEFEERGVSVNALWPKTGTGISGIIFCTGEAISLIWIRLQRRVHGPEPFKMNTFFLEINFK